MMDRNGEKLASGNSERVLRELTLQQHLHPAWDVERALSAVCDNHGFEPALVAPSLQQTGVSKTLPIGRLSRDQVRELATQLDSNWQAELASRIRKISPDIM